MNTGETTVELTAAALLDSLDFTFLPNLTILRAIFMKILERFDF